MKTAICLSGWLALALIAHAGVYDDTAAWWHFDYDPDHNPAGLNVAQLSDIRDQRDWGTTATPGASGRQAIEIGGEYGGPLWTNAPVVCPAGGKPYGGLSLHFPQITNSQGEIKPDAIRLNTSALGGSATIVMRFRWDGRFFHTTQPDWIYNNSLEWSNRRGWMFGIRHEGGSADRPHPICLLAGQSYIHGPNVMSNVWYDAAAVITDNGDGDTVEFFLWAENGTLDYSRHTTSVVATEPGNGDCVIGCETPPRSTYTDVTVNGNANEGKCFKGLLNHLALWNRALSRDEVLEAFCFPQPLIQIGVDDGSASELRAEGETGSAFNADDPWHVMPQGVSASRRTVTLNIPITAVQTNCNYIFHLKAAASDGGQSAKLLLSVNGQTHAVREALRVYPSQDIFWPIAKERLVAGTNAFAITYTGGPAAWVAFDWMELGGAWQVGIENMSQHEFNSESSAPDDFYITDPDWMHLERAIVYSDSRTETNTVLHFSLSPEIATNANARFAYTTRVVDQGPRDINPTPTHPFSIAVNGNILYQTGGIADGAYVTIPFEPGQLRPGANRISLMIDTETTSWIQFDFHRLSTTPWELPNRSGSLLSVQ